MSRARPNQRGDAARVPFIGRMRSVGLIDDKKKGVPISKTFFERQNKKLLAAKAKRNNEKEVEKKTKQSNLLKFLTKGK